MTTTTSGRRRFLLGLASLPLIGGGVTLTGRPTAAAVPVTPGLLDAYDEWLDRERDWLRWERFGSWPGGNRLVFANVQTGEVFDWSPRNRVMGYDPSRAPASSRAAVILSAAGCGWRETAGAFPCVIRDGGSR